MDESSNLRAGGWFAPPHFLTRGSSPGPPAGGLRLPPTSAPQPPRWDPPRQRGPLPAGEHPAAKLAHVWEGCRESWRELFVAGEVGCRRSWAPGACLSRPARCTRPGRCRGGLVLKAAGGGGRGGRLLPSNGCAPRWVVIRPSQDA